jgi:hypothetical protein
MNVAPPIVRQPKLLTEGARRSPVLLAMKVEFVEKSRKGASSPPYSIEAISIRAETMTSVLEEILRRPPTTHWGINE